MSIEIEQKRSSNEGRSATSLLLHMLYFLLKNRKLYLSGAIFFGSVSGIATAALVATLNAAIVGAGHEGVASRFSLLLAIVVMAGFFSSYLLIDISQKAAEELRILLSNRIASLSYIEVERKGSARLIATLSTDIPSLTQVISVIPGVVTSVTVITACFVYLAILSPKYFMVIVFGMVSIFIVHRILTVQAKPYLTMARDWRDTLFESYRTLTLGAKELSLDRSGKQAFLEDDIGLASKEIQHCAASAARRYAAAGMSTQLIFFSVIGVIAFVINLNVSPEAKTGYILTTLFLIGPLRHLLGVVGQWAAAKVAIKKIFNLGLLSKSSDETYDRAESLDTPLRNITFCKVEFSHEMEGRSDDKFVVGPLSVDFNVGEITFIVGGNGSGKSTFLKLITGLYSPSSGQIKISDLLVENRCLDWYREQFSAVFFDFYLFKKQFQMGLDADREKVVFWMERFGINISLLEEKSWSGAIPLSQGQQRRLALISALVSDRLFFVFDEWAADQDKRHRDFFYNELIPNLKRKGKCVIVVSHDENFFGVADKIIRMDKGTMVVEFSSPKILREEESFCE